MDEFDTLAEELVDMFEDRDELSAAIGEALRGTAAKAYTDAIRIVDSLSEAELTAAKSPLLYDDEEENHRIAARALENASTRLFERRNEVSQ